MQGIPYGAKSRLLMIHLCTAAKLQRSPEVETSHSMSAYMQDLGMAVTGGKTGSIGRFKEQLNRLAAPRMQLLFQDDDKISIRKSLHLKAEYIDADCYPSSSASLSRTTNH